MKAQTGRLAGYVVSVVRELYNEARSNRVLVACVLIYGLITWGCVAYYDAPFQMTSVLVLWPVFVIAAFIGLVLLLMFRAFMAGHFFRPSLMLDHLIRDTRMVLTPAALAGGLFVAVLGGPFGQLTGMMKSLIDVINPHHWDPLLSFIDCTIHGVCPNQFLTPIVANEWTFRWSSYFYDGIWPIVTGLVLISLAFIDQRGRRRSRFLLTFVLAWAVLGTGVAILFNSGGPVFYQLYTGSNKYAQLMQHLHVLAAHVEYSTVTVMNLLRDLNTGQIPPPAMGISAMPSLHVSMAALTSIYLWGSGHKWTRMIGVIYLILVLVCSVGLGWHYAIDGYVAIAGTFGLWWLTGLLINRGKETNNAYILECH